MTRTSSTTRSGGRFDEATIEAVWRKGVPVPGLSTMRRDACGAAMMRQFYGDRSSRFGWEIDHQIPVALGGGDNLSNLQPLQWENNAYKGDRYPGIYCKVGR